MVSFKKSFILGIVVTKVSKLFFFFLISGGENFSIQILFSCGLCPFVEETHLISDFLCYLWNLDIELKIHYKHNQVQQSLKISYGAFTTYSYLMWKLVWPSSNWIPPCQVLPTESYQNLRMTTSCRKKSFLAWIANL